MPLRWMGGTLQTKVLTTSRSETRASLPVNFTAVRPAAVQFLSVPACQFLLGSPFRDAGRTVPARVDRRFRDSFLRFNNHGLSLMNAPLFSKLPPPPARSFVPRELDPADWPALE